MSEPAASDIELPFLRLHPLGIALKSSCGRYQRSTFSSDKACSLPP